MKAKSIFETISEADRQIVFHTCNQMPFRQAAIFLSLPRSEGGLEIKTSKSALQRFFSTCHFDTPKFDHAADFTDMVKALRQECPFDFYPTAIAVGEAHILTGFKRGQSFVSMKEEI